MSTRQHTCMPVFPARLPALRHSKEAAALDLTIAGVPLTIDGLDATLRSRAHDLFRPFAEQIDTVSPPAARIRVEAASDALRWTVIQDGHAVMSTTDPDRLLSYLDWLSVSLALEATTQRAVFHCAALVRDGELVLLVAESGAGKTTLTLGLMQRGWAPLADDIVLVDCQTLGITAFPRCFHVDAATRVTITDQSLLVWPGAVEGYARPVKWAAGSQWASCVVLVQRDADAPSLCRPVAQAEAAGALAAAAIRNQIPPGERVRVAAQVVAAAKTCVSLRNGQLKESLDLIEATASLSMAARQRAHQGTLAMSTIVPPRAARPTRRPEIETYILPDGSALLYDPQSESGHPLDVVRALIWDYCEGQLTGDQIAQELAALLPQAPDAVTYTLSVLEEFATAGLLAKPETAARDATAAS